MSLPRLDQLFDGLYYGVVISTVLFGVTTVQAWIYAKTNKDTWLLQSLVAALVLLDLGTTFLNSEVVRFYLLSNFGNVITLSSLSPALKAEILLSFIVVFIVNLFFSSRIYLLRQIHWLVVVAIVSTALGAAISGLLVAIELFQNKTLIIISTGPLRTKFCTSLGLSAGAEIISTIALSYSLHVSRTGFKATDNMIKKIFHFVVARGALLAVFQILTLVMFMVRDTLDWLPMHFILTRLYVITVVAMLNARRDIRRQNVSVFSDADFRSHGNVRVDNESPSYSGAMRDHVGGMYISAAVYELHENMDGTAKP